MRAFVIGFALLILSACTTPQIQELGLAINEPFLEGSTAVMADGERLPMHVWQAKKPKAVVIGVHGMNGYAEDFGLPGPWFAKRGISFYAYDQRSFGRTDTAKLGIWPGGEAMVSDLKSVYALVQQKHKGLPVYVIGLSMGGAVTMKALDNGLAPAGAVLVAPAVWGWRAMNPFIKSTLWITAHVAPSYSPTGESLDIWPSDNIEVLRAIGRDPLYQSKTRSDTIYGLVTLMDEAYDSAERLKGPILYLYGKNDQIVPADPTHNVIGRIRAPKRVAIYKNGWHMLLRDKQREVVWKDIAAWIVDKGAALPSGEERKVKKVAQK
ncbi:MAG: lysophospholipase [Pseudomonadota bacterium]